jgi:ParB family transcriptional regulator, chromosome partitioning protein
MTRKALFDIPISEIRIVNPRTRNKMHFEEVVRSIAAVGLKKPITVARRLVPHDGTQYDLVCGQGRIEAFLALGQTTIPANIIEVSKEDQLVMSLVENIARRAPSNKHLLQEVICLRNRGYEATDIASKLGREVSFIASIIRLIDRNETALVEAVEANRIPLYVALVIDSAEGADIQRALSQAYESGELRGSRLKKAKRIIAAHGAKRLLSERPTQSPSLTGRALVREYQRRTREQQELVKRASRIREKLLLLKSAMKTLLADEHFLMLLRAEDLQDVPDELACDGAVSV